MGTFAVDVVVKNLHDPSRSRRLSVLVDTGATYTTLSRTTLSREVADALGCRSIGTRRVLWASGREEEWPVLVISIVLEGQEGPSFCLIGPEGGPARLGAVTLEECALAVDRRAKRLVPVRSYLTQAPAAGHTVATG